MSNTRESVIERLPALHAPAAPSDADLVARVRQGEREAFDMLVLRHKDRIYNTLYWYLGDHGDAEDIAQEAFIRAYLRMPRFRGEAAFGTWLYAIAVNLAQNRLRDRGRKGRNRAVALDDAALAAPGAAPSPHAAAVARETQSALERCLGGLSEPLRLTFVLRVMDGFSYHDIAETTETREGTVKSRLNDARRRLRDCLSAAGVL